jgi:hypothetical protein
MKMKTEINSNKNDKLKSVLRKFTNENSDNTNTKVVHKAICFTKIDDKYFDLFPMDELYGYLFIYFHIIFNK